MNFSVSRAGLSIALVASAAFVMTGCSASASSMYFGKTTPPSANVLRYVSGSEPESLDPAVSNSQPDARIYMSMYDGLIEYEPKTMEPIPSLAKSWEIREEGTEYIFHIRDNGKFSNGAPITAHDFVFTLRRGFSPELASRNASLGYYIKYSEAYNASKVFVKCGDRYLLKDGGLSEATQAADIHSFLDQPERLTLAGDEAGREKAFKAAPELKAQTAGCSFQPVKAEDIGVEAIDDHTLRIKLYQPAPYFLGLLGHQFFRVVSKDVVEKFGSRWSRPENIVTSGAFKLLEHRPYDRLVVVRDPNHWDAANVHLDRIEFFPLDEQTTMQNLYKAGDLDATYNHTVPAAWFDTIKKFTAEYQLHPENASEFYVISVKKPPMDKVKVRQAFSLAIDRQAWAQFRRTYKPLVYIIPFGIYPKYEEARTKVWDEELKKQGSSLDEWKAREFDAEKARKLLTEAGYPVQQTATGWSCPSFPVDNVSITYNTSESNKATAEFVQAQWKQNLGITVPLQNMEFRTFLPMLNKVEYSGFGRRGWIGDYMDPFTFLYLYYSEGNESATGWWDPKVDAVLDEANKTVDEQRRYELLAKAELMVAQAELTIPLGVPGTSFMKKPYVKGMYPNPGVLHPWKFVYIERDPAKWDKVADDILKISDPQVDQEVRNLIATQEEFKAQQAAAQQ